MTTVYADTETFSELNLKTVGGYRYAEECEVLLCQWAVDDGPVRVEEGLHPDFLRALEEAELTVWHNSQFDRVVLKEHGVDLPVEKIEDTMILALLHSLPPSLGMLCDVLGVPVDLAKEKSGKKLIQLFCKPRPKNMKVRRATKETHPDEWQAFVEYARLDVESMRVVRSRIPRWNYTRRETDLWRLDQRASDIGIAVDAELARSALRAFRRTSGSLADAIGSATGGVVGSATQRAKLIDHLRDAYGFNVADLTKATVAKLVADPDTPDEVRALLENRQQASATSPAKYQTILNAQCRDGRIRGMVQFAGAGRTTRDAGRLVQWQNLPRPTLSAVQIEVGIAAMKADCEDIL